MYRHMAKYDAGSGARTAAVALRTIAASHFHCFCHKAFYISNFKDFNTSAPAC